MSKQAAPNEWRQARRQSARDAIVDAAWVLVREEGLAALTLRDLAKRAKITTPTVYAYFDSKHAIYDAMFGQAATEFADLSSKLESLLAEDPQALFTESMRNFVDFCTSDVARYQLLFQRTIPGFEPSAESYEPAVRALDAMRSRFARHGITNPRHIDMWTAMLTGVVDQQISNDPGGDRWARLIDDCVAMYLDYCKPTNPPARRAKPSAKRKTPTNKGESS